MSDTEAPKIARRKKSLKSRVLFAFFCIAATLAVPPLVMEAFFFTAIRHPFILRYAPAPLRAETRIQYWLFDAWEIQYMPSCARYDEKLAYTLKPGTSSFSNIEFSNRFDINSAGLRDDEESLDQPEIIVAGDSQAMGWGVNQDETFPRGLERLTGKKVLNAGVSSYGTVREMAMASRYFSPRLKVLIIQYSDNDYSENLSFKKGGNRLVIMPESRYDAMCALPGDKDYKFMQYTNFELLKLRFEDGYRNSMAPPPSPENLADLFLNAVEAYGRGRLSNVLILAFEVGSHNRYCGFVEGLSREKSRAFRPEWIRNIKALDISRVVSPESFYIMDGHLTKNGHFQLAGFLASVIEKDLKTAGTPGEARLKNDPP